MVLALLHALAPTLHRALVTSEHDDDGAFEALDICVALLFAVGGLPFSIVMALKLSQLTMEVRSHGGGGWLWLHSLSSRIAHWFAMPGGVQFWNYLMGMTRLRAILTVGKAQRFGLPVYFDMTHSTCRVAYAGFHVFTAWAMPAAYSVIAWSRMRAYAVTRLAAPIDAKQTLFAFLLVSSIALSALVFVQIIFLEFSVIRLDVVMELVLLVNFSVFLLQVR